MPNVSVAIVDIPVALAPATVTVLLLLLLLSVSSVINYKLQERQRRPTLIMSGEHF